MHSRAWQSIVSPEVRASESEALGAQETGLPGDLLCSERFAPHFCLKEFQKGQCHPSAWELRRSNVPGDIRSRARFALAHRQSEPRPLGLKGVFTWIDAPSSSGRVQVRPPWRSKSNLWHRLSQ